jgi:predicted lipoprotein with Yx(FWY)xxD motif
MNMQHDGATRRMKRAHLLLPIGILAGGLATSLALPAAAQASTAKATRTTVVMAAKRAHFGSILVTTSGATLYTYAKDMKNRSNCNSGCISFWPALVVPAGSTPVGKGVTGLGVIRRANGQQQVTYQGKPLYRFLEDKKVGQVAGQGVNHFSVVKLGSTVAGTSTTTTSKPPASNGIPQNNGGDGDSDNSGGPSDGDGNL